jgi:hypothetical protein
VDEVQVRRDDEAPDTERGRGHRGHATADHRPEKRAEDEGKQRPTSKCDGRHIEEPGLPLTLDADDLEPMGAPTKESTEPTG